MKKLSLISLALLASCGVSNIPARSQTAAVTPANSIKSLSFTTTCDYNSIPTNSFVTDMFSWSGCPGRIQYYYEPLNSSGMKICDAGNDIAAKLPLNWVITGAYFGGSSTACNGTTFSRTTYDIAPANLTAPFMYVCPQSPIPYGYKYSQTSPTGCGFGSSYMLIPDNTPPSTPQLGTVSEIQPNPDGTFIQENGNVISPTPAMPSSGLSTLSLPHDCKLMADGFYFRRQSIPSASQTPDPAYVSMNVILPNPSNITLFSNLKPTPYVYLGGRSFSANGVSMDAGLSYDKITQTYAIFAQRSDISRVPRGISTRINGLIYRISPGSYIKLEFYIDASNRPILNVTAPSYKVYQQVWSDPKTSKLNYLRDENTNLTKQFILGDSSQGWRWKPVGNAGGVGQPMKAMVSMAYTGASVGSFSSSLDRFSQVNITNMNLAVIKGFTNLGNPIITPVGWPSTYDPKSYCLTAYTMVNSISTNSGIFTMNPASQDTIGSPLPVVGPINAQ